MIIKNLTILNFSKCAPLHKINEYDQKEYKDQGITTQRYLTNLHLQSQGGERDIITSFDVINYLIKNKETIKTLNDTDSEKAFRVYLNMQNNPGIDIDARILKIIETNIENKNIASEINNKINSIDSKINAYTFFI